MKIEVGGIVVEIEPDGDEVRVTLRRSAEPAPEREALLTIREAADFCDVSRQTVYNWIRQGLIEKVDDYSRRLDNGKPTPCVRGGELLAALKDRRRS